MEKDAYALTMSRQNQNWWDEDVLVDKTDKTVGFITKLLCAASIVCFALLVITLVFGAAGTCIGAW